MVLTTGTGHNRNRRTTGTGRPTDRLYSTACYSCLVAVFMLEGGVGDTHNVGVVSLYSVGVVSLYSVGVVSLYSVGVVSLYSVRVVCLYSVRVVSLYSVRVIPPGIVVTPPSQYCCDSLLQVLL